MQCKWAMFITFSCPTNRSSGFRYDKENQQILKAEKEKKNQERFYQFFIKNTETTDSLHHPSKHKKNLNICKEIILIFRGKCLVVIEICLMKKFILELWFSGNQRPTWVANGWHYSRLSAWKSAQSLHSLFCPEDTKLTIKREKAHVIIVGRLEKVCY